MAEENSAAEAASFFERRRTAEEMRRLRAEGEAVKWRSEQRDLDNPITYKRRTKKVPPPVQRYEGAVAERIRRAEQASLELRVARADATIAANGLPPRRVRVVDETTARLRARDGEKFFARFQAMPRRQAEETVASQESLIVMMWVQSQWLKRRARLETVRRMREFIDGPSKISRLIDQVLSNPRTAASISHEVGLDAQMRELQHKPQYDFDAEVRKRAAQRVPTDATDVHLMLEFMRSPLWWHEHSALALKDTFEWAKAHKAVSQDHADVVFHMTQKVLSHRSKTDPNVREVEVTEAGPVASPPPQPGGTSLSW